MGQGILPGNNGLLDKGIISVTSVKGFVQFYLFFPGNIGTLFILLGENPHFYKHPFACLKWNVPMVLPVDFVQFAQNGKSARLKWPFWLSKLDWNQKFLTEIKKFLPIARSYTY